MAEVMGPNGYLGNVPLPLIKLQSGSDQKLFAVQ